MKKNTLLRITSIACLCISFAMSDHKPCELTLADLGAVQLHGGMHEFGPLVQVAMMSIKHLAAESPTAFIELIKVSTDLDYKIADPAIRSHLQELALIDSTGRPHESLRNIIRAALEIKKNADGEPLGLALRSPVDRESKLKKLADIPQLPHVVLSADVPALKDYYSRAQEIASYILKTLRKHGVWAEGRLGEGVNPFYNQIRFNGGIAVEYYYGCPSSIWTPLGKIEITGSTSSSGKQVTDAVAEINEKLGFREIVPVNHTSNATYGPVVELSKNLDGNPLPSVELVKPSAYIDYKEALDVWRNVAPNGRSRR